MLRRSHDVAGPTAQRPVVHIGRRRVIESAGGALVRVLRGRNVSQVAAAVERPVKADGRRARVHLADQADRLVLQRTVNLLRHVQWRRRCVLVPPAGRV